MWNKEIFLGGGVDTCKVIFEGLPIPLDGIPEYLEVKRGTSLSDLGITSINFPTSSEYYISSSSDITYSTLSGESKGVFRSSTKITEDIVIKVSYIKVLPAGTQLNFSIILSPSTYTADYGSGGKIHYYGAYYAKFSSSASFGSIRLSSSDLDFYGNTQRWSVDVNEGSYGIGVGSLNVSCEFTIKNNRNVRGVTIQQDPAITFATNSYSSKCRISKPSEGVLRLSCPTSVQNPNDEKYLRWTSGNTYNFTLTAK